MIALLSFVAGLMNPSQCVASPKLGDIVVVIDPGHGGRDSGALSTLHSAIEKDINLQIARKVSEELVRRRPIVVIMTRSSDSYLSLAHRRQIVSRCQPDMVISIHADSGPSTAEGAAVYALNEAGEAIVIERLARKRRKGNEGDDLPYIMANIQQRASINSAIVVGAEIQRELRRSGPVWTKPRAANFAMLKAPGVPSILVECGFITNPSDAKWLLSESGQRQIAKSIALPITRLIKKYRAL